MKQDNENEQLSRGEQTLNVKEDFQSDIESKSENKVKSEADPCFAKVVEGFDAVDRMHLLSVEKGSYQRLKNYVAIKKMTILKDWLLFFKRIVIV